MNLLKLSFLSFGLCVLSLSTGCGTVGGTFAKTVTPTPLVQTVTVLQTNIVVQTNQVTVTLTNGVVEIIPVYSTNQVVERQSVTTTNVVNVTNYSVSPGASNVLATIGAVNGATAGIDPY